jgi:hypothetical protein
MFHILQAAPLVLMIAAAPKPADLESELVPVVLHIDVSPLEREQEKQWVDLTYKIAQRYIPPMLKKQGITLVDAAETDAATVTIVMSWIDYPNSIYATDIAVTRPGFPDRKLDRIICDPCIDHMVVDQLEPHLPKLLPWLAADLPEPQPEAPAPAPAEDGPPRSQATVPAEPTASGTDGVDSHPPPRMGALGWAGIATASIGAAALISGGIVFARDEREVSLTPTTRQYRDFRPPGVATMAVGGVALGAGVAMICSHLLIRKRSRTTAMVAVGRGHGVVTITRRF